jgi:hypothetical protein
MQSDPRLKDREWRMSHLWRIKDKNQSLIKFKKNRAQQHFDQNRHTRNIILKSRQLGFSTYEAIDIIDETAFSQNFDSLFIAQDLDTAKDIFSNKIELAWNNFILRPFYIVNTDSARQLKLNLGSQEKPIISSITVDSSGRSGTYRRVHITEFASVCRNFPDKAKEIISGTIPAIPLDGRVDIESTADGSSGIFHDMFWEAWERGNPKLPTEFKAHFYNWTWDDAEIDKITDEQINIFLSSSDYDLFKDYQKRHELKDDEITYYYLKWLSLNKNWAELKKEYPTTPFEAFATSGNKLFDEQYIERFQIKQPIKIENNWTIYENAILGHRYGIGADVSEGIGRDHSTAVIWDFTYSRPKVVATYKNNKIAPDMFAFELKNYGFRYEEAVIAPERNNHGHTVISKLREIYPESLIYVDDKNKMGWHTNLVSKPKMFYDMNTATNNELVDIPSQAVVSEMRRFEREDLRVKSYDEETTNHFDLLMATVIGFQLKDYMPMEASKMSVTYNEV